jgi:lipoprotein-anchoring transpeptidase ErfK/SrfK
VDGSDATEPSAPRAGRRSVAGWSLIGVGALIPVIPILIGIVLIAAADTKAAPAAVMHPLRASVPAVALPKHGLTHVEGSTVALVVRPTTMYAAPNGAVIAPQPLRTPFNSPTVLLVRRIVPGWVGVLSPLAGNGRVGWLPTLAVSLRTINWTIRVSLAQRKLTVLEGRKVMERYLIAIGRPTAPTPTGEFAVTDRLETGDPEGPYGCCIIAISALAPHAIQDWDGGNRIAIHSTPDVSTIGDAVSHGCMHVTSPEGQWLIDHVPLGTPVIVRE